MGCRGDKCIPQTYVIRDYSKQCDPHAELRYSTLGKKDQLERQYMITIHQSKKSNVKTIRLLVEINYPFTKDNPNVSCR